MRKHRWRDRIIVLVALLLFVAAVFGRLATPSWIAINKPGDFLRFDAEAGSWHLAFVHIPAPPVEEFVKGMGDVGKQPDFQRIMQQYQASLDTQRYFSRNMQILRCDWARSLYVSRGDNSYFEDVWRRARQSQPDANVPEPMVWIAGVSALYLIAPAILLLIIPTYAAWDHRRQMRLLRYCRTCGYDLTGNTTGVCSECGNSLPPGMQPPAPSTP